jgi:hypothetical protein
MTAVTATPSGVDLPDRLPGRRLRPGVTGADSELTTRRVLQDPLDAEESMDWEAPAREVPDKRSG